MRLIFSAVLSLAGGFVLLGTLAIDYMSPGGFWIYIGTQGIGFVLLLASSALSWSAFRQRSAWALYLAGSCGWLFCWSWFLHLGLFIPIPLLFWAAVSSGFYVMSAFICGATSDPSGAVLAAVLAVGSVLSTWAMALSPTFASDYIYVPVAAGALLGGVLLGGKAFISKGRSVPRFTSSAP